MTKRYSIELRIIIPRGLKYAGEHAYVHAADFFATRGVEVYLQTKLMQLSSSLPAIIEGTVPYSDFDAFVLECPYLDRIIVLSDGKTKAARAAA